MWSVIYAAAWFSHSHTPAARHSWQRACGVPGTQQRDHRNGSGVARPFGGSSSHAVAAALACDGALPPR